MWLASRYQIVCGRSGDTNTGFLQIIFDQVFFHTPFLSLWVLKPYVGQIQTIGDQVVSAGMLIIHAICVDWSWSPSGIMFVQKVVSVLQWQDNGKTVNVAISFRTPFE